MLVVYPKPMTTIKTILYRTNFTMCTEYNLPSAQAPRQFVHRTIYLPIDLGTTNFAMHTEYNLPSQ